MSAFKSMFDIFDITISQILLTEEDFDSRVHTEIFTVNEIKDVYYK
jgi:glutamate 5-kinase